MGRLDEFVHKVDTLWLLFTDIFTPSVERVVEVERGVILVVVVPEETEDSRPLLLVDYVESAKLAKPPRGPASESEGGVCSFEFELELQIVQKDLSRIKAPSDQVGLSDLSDLDQRSDESHFFVS